MREIKFRAWNDIDKVMLSFDLYQTCNYPNSGFDSMQYTGLKDKNGVEIYEGDIVKTVAMENDHHQRGAIDFVAVRSFAGNFCLCFGDNETGIPIYPFNVTHKVEVIGNIYETPELLEDK